MSQLLSKNSKFNNLLENFFSPKSPLEFLGLALITTLINLLSSGNPVGIIGTILVALVWWQVNRKIENNRQEKIQEKTRYRTIKQSPKFAKGLILLLSPYSPRNSLLSFDKVETKINYICQTSLNKLSEDDFQEINLLNSNLLTQIKAIEYHLEGGTLRDIWLINTPSIEELNIKGSQTTAIILETYLRFKYGNKLEIHRQEFGNQKLLVDDSDYEKLYEIVDYIFKESGYKDEVIVADITGGTKMMSVALAMACIPPKRKMQYMDSQRDWEGNPLKTGEIKPILIDVDPILYFDE
ncbi:MAG: hypothetical protein QNJ37_01405 [Crocosphaera sp.]|nr:hypothetical protein [Crocosphaera sp.]